MGKAEKKDGMMKEQNESKRQIKNKANQNERKIQRKRRRYTKEEREGPEQKTE
jgi:hypothetical protein